MEHLFRVWPEFAQAMQAAPHIIFLTDYDGTLTPIVGHPEDAVLPTPIRQKLIALAGKQEISVGVISGRTISELKSLTGIEGIYYSGNHGLEIEGPGLSYINPRAEAGRPMIRELGAQMAEALKDIEGVIIQEKGLSVSVHYRLVRPEEENAITSAVKRIAAPYVAKGQIRIYPMKKVWEMRDPLGWDKGKAVALIRSKIEVSLKLSRLPTIYMGDDTTDEDAFKVLHRPDDWSVFIGNEKAPSAAAYYLNSVEETGEMLDRLGKLK